MTRLARVAVLCDNCSGSQALVYCVEHEVGLCKRCEDGLHKDDWGGGKKKRARMAAMIPQPTKEVQMLNGRGSMGFGLSMERSSKPSLHMRVPITNVITALPLCDLCDRRPATVSF